MRAEFKGECAMIDSPDDDKNADETEQDAIRGAFLARQAQAASAPQGGGDGAPASLALGGAYLSRLAKEARGGSGRVAGSEDSGDAALRSAFAARSTPTAAPAPRAPSRKAAPKKAAPKKATAKKAAPKKTAKKAAKKAAKRAAPKAKKAAARTAPKRKAAPVRPAKKKAKSAKRRR
jgi:hypothetical protein